MHAVRKPAFDISRREVFWKRELMRFSTFDLPQIHPGFVGECEVFFPSDEMAELVTGISCGLAVILDSMTLTGRGFLISMNPIAATRTIIAALAPITIAFVLRRTAVDGRGRTSTV
jgi:hypothetical protein